MTSIRRRLLVGTGVGVGAALLVSSVLIYLLARRSLRDQLDDALSAEARALALLVEQEGGRVESDLGEHGATALGPATAPRYVEVWDDRGQSLERTPTLGEGHLLAPAGGLDTVVHRAVRLPGGAPGRQATLTFVPRREDDGDAATPPRRAVLALARDVGALDDTMARLRTALVLGGAVTTLLTLLLLAWISRYGLRPVRTLADDIAAMQAPGLSARLALAGVPIELRPVVERLNALLGRVEAAFARERELTAELAHELRTPIAGIRVVLELALSQEREPARYRSAIAEVLTICAQTQRIIESLLSLARLDAGLVVSRARPVAFAELTEEVVAGCGPTIAARGLTVTRALEHRGVVTTDPELLRLLVWNLVDNALTYVDAGGWVTVGLTSAAGAVRLRIENTGSRLAQADVERAFERFWRGDAARSDRGHVGLGLALCRKIATVLGGGVTITSSAGGVFAVTVVLPLGDDARAGLAVAGGPTSPEHPATGRGGGLLMDLS